MSLPTSLALSPGGSLLASAGKDKVVNFYDLKKKSAIVHLKTVAVMDELEGVVILSFEDSSSILGISSAAKPSKKPTLKSALKGGNSAAKQSDDSEQPLVLVCAGEKGLLRLYKVTFEKRAELVCLPLYQISLSHATSVVPTSVSSSSALLRSITGLHYLSSMSELVAVTTDHNFCSYRIRERSPDDDAATPVINLERQIVGYNDDILDIAFVPRAAAKSANGDEEADENVMDVVSSPKPFLLAVVTNSPTVRLMDQSFGFSLLDGHEDIVLAVDACPDGYVFPSTLFFFNLVLLATIISSHALFEACTAQRCRRNFLCLHSYSLRTVKRAATFTHESGGLHSRSLPSLSTRQNGKRD